MKTINPADLERSQVYKLITGSIIPRPIAWVSTVSEAGVPNLAPYSYFSAIGANPPLVLFCPGTRSVDGLRKDTYYNVKATGEFVVNFVNGATAAAMNITATEVAADVDEFQRAGLTPIASETINVPRVAESPIQFECKVYQIVDAGEGSVVIGEILRMHFADDIFQEGNYIDVEAYDPIARLAGPNYAHLGKFFSLQRPPSEITKK